MIISVPIFLQEETKRMKVEVQLRTIAMDFWASLEHDIRYKVDKTKLPEGINEEMLECSGKIARLTGRCRICTGGSRRRKRTQRLQP